ncbi:MAG: hypothetical protein ABS36_16965 [Acidobacteria bacterium SCN 69-37]|nr:MAG: hypothetical protein ABS36_16965 [Acidobacteria bacterium SCN 69-37]
MASIAGIIFGASLSPQTVQAEWCENDECYRFDPIGFEACRPASQATGCDMDSGGGYHCDSYSCS